MMPFNVALSESVRSNLTIFVEVLFWIFVPVSFICVGNYALKQQRAGHLINGPKSPPPFDAPDIQAWLFIASVILFIFLQSAYYVLLVIFGIMGLLLQNGRTFPEQFGLLRLKPIRIASWSLLVFGAVMLIESPLSEASEWLLKAVHLPDQDQQSVETFRSLNRPSVIFAFIFEVVFIFPFIEELFFRGFLFTFLKKHTSTWAAIVLSAGAFAFAHVNLAAALPLWVLGIVLGLAYENTGCLLLPIGIHACWNLVTALSILLDKGNP